MQPTRNVVLTLCVLVCLLTSIVPRTFTQPAAAAEPAAPAPGWNVTMVDNATSTKTGWRPSIAIHPVTQQPYVSYHDVTNGALRLAKRDATSVGECGTWGWTCWELNNFDRAGEASSIGFVPGGNGAYAIAYTLPDEADIMLLKVAVDGTYSHTDIFLNKGPADGDNEVSGFPSLTFRTGKPFVAVYGSSRYELAEVGYPDVRYSGSYFVGGELNNDPETGPIDLLETSDEDVPVDYGYYSSLDFGGSTNSPRIAYRGHDQRLQYAVYSPSYQDATCFETYEDEIDHWHCRTVDPAPKTGYYVTHKAPRLVGNSYTHTQIAYHDAANGLLKYATIVDTNATCGAGGSPGFQCSVIDNVGTSNGPMGAAMALDSQGQPVIAYYDRNDGDHGVLKVARLAPNSAGNCGPSKSWQCTVVDDGGPTGDDVGQWAAIALDNQGKAYVAYYNSSRQALMVAHEKSDTLPQFTASANPTTVQQGASVTLTYKLHNPSKSAGLSGLSFTHGLSFHTFVPNTLQTTCGNPQLGIVNQNHAIKLTAATLAPNSSCTVTVKITADTQGTANMNTTTLKSNEANDGAPAEMTLVVVAPNTPVPPTDTPIPPTATTPPEATSTPTTPSTPTPIIPSAPTSTPTTPGAPPATATSGAPGTTYRVYLPLVRH